MRTDSEWKKLADRYLEIAAKLADAKDLEKERDFIRDQLVELSGGESIGGCGISVEKITRRGNVDHARILKSYDIDGEQHRKSDTVYYKITTHTQEY